MKKLCMKQIFMALVIFIALIGCSSLLVYSAENENYGLSNAEYDGYIVSVELDPYLASLAEEDGEPIQAIVEDKNLYYAKDLAEVERLKEMGKVSYVEPNYIVELADVDISADTANGTAWAHTMIGMDTTLKNGYLGEGVKIGIIDSGLNTTHYDIRDAVIEGYDYYSNDEIYTDSLGHGTFVAGICAARLNGQGMIGVAPKSDIVVLKAFEGNNTSANVIAKAIYGGVDNFGCDVLNMSFALTVNSQILKDAIDYANSKGVLISAAVGNNSKSNPITYPAAYDNVIGVGSVNNLKKVYISSIKSEAVFVAAPGVSISSMS